MMEINKNCKLCLKDVYNYDIEKCNYNMLISLGYDVSNIPLEKEQRNIAIGLLQRENPNLTKILRSMVINIIDQCLTQNNVKKEEELITRQFDGFIVTRKLGTVIDIMKCTKYRDLIISPGRDFYLAIKSGSDEVLVKGISRRYEGINNFYQKLAEINFLSKIAIFKKLDFIKKELFECEKIRVFCIPTKDSKSYDVCLVRHGFVNIKEGTVRLLKITDIDKEWYFDHYLKPFTDSILIEYS